MYLPIGAALAMVGLYYIGVYISRRHNTVPQYISTRPIMDLCLAAEQKPLMRLFRRWWEQLNLDIIRIRSVQSDTEEEGETEGE